MALLGVKDNTSTAFLQPEYLTYVVVAAAACPCYAAMPLENLLGKIRILSSRPIVEFSSFEAMKLIEAIKDATHDSKNEKANYYKLTCETLRSKLHGCFDIRHFPSSLSSLGSAVRFRSARSTSDAINREVDDSKLQNIIELPSAPYSNEALQSMKSDVFVIYRVSSFSAC